MVTKAVSFSFVAGVSPLVGLWATIVLGCFAALIVGRVVICRLRKMNVSDNDESLLSQLVEIYQCSILHSVMVDPSIVDGPCHHSVSREPAAEWYRQGSLVCPVCNAPVRSANLSPNVQAREVIELIQRIQGQISHEQGASQREVAKDVHRRRGHEKKASHSIGFAMKCLLVLGLLFAFFLLDNHRKVVCSFLGEGIAFGGLFSHIMDGFYDAGSYKWGYDDKSVGNFEAGKNSGISIHQHGHGQQALRAPVAQTKRFRSNDGVWGDYVGELDANGLRHGEGKMTWDDGEVHEGEWRNDNPNGWGTLSLPDGRTYAGHLKNGVVHGHGIVQWANGNSYDGEWKDGEMGGQGTYKWPDGDKYVGGLRSNKMSGVGTYHFYSGCIKMSLWKNGKESGEGVRWSVYRRRAWLLNSGKIVHEIDMTKAKAIVSRLGFSEVPRSMGLGERVKLSFWGLLAQKMGWRELLTHGYRGMTHITHIFD